MKVLILTTSHPHKAAGIVANDLLIGLSSIEGNDVRILVREWDKYEDGRIIPIETTIEHYFIAIKRRIKRLRIKILKIISKDYKTKEEKFNDRINGDYYFEYNLTETFFSTKRILKRSGFQPEVVLVLFMTTFISFKNLNEIFKLTGAPIFLYLMDMAPFTGGCHYAWDCIGYIKGCEKCQAITSMDQNNQAHLNYMYKKKYIDKTQIFTIGASEWQCLQLMKSSLFKDKRKFKVLLPINEKMFCSTDKIKVREELGLPLEKKIIFFGAVAVDEKRKGFSELIGALNILYQKTSVPSNIHLAIAGNNSSNFKDSLLFSFSILGYLDQNDLPKAFQAADVFVSPSIEDSGPMMVNQSIMCGTPVVSFKTGVVLDLVRNKETGYMANLNDTIDLANGIKYILELDDLEYRDMSTKCRETGISLCQPQKKCKELMDIFNCQL